MKRFLLALTICAAALAGCGQEEPGGTEDATPTPTPGGTPEETPRLLPLVIGASWTFRSTDLETGETNTKIRFIEALEDVGDRKSGVQGYRMRVENAGGYSLSWHEDLGPGAGVVRHREQSFEEDGTFERDEFYEAYKLRADERPEHLVTGATWTETYVETIVKPDVPEASEEEVRHWEVISDHESLTVPAGTFETIHVRRWSPAGGTDKEYWFVPGIGTVKEIELEGKALELVEWSIP